MKRVRPVNEEEDAVTKVQFDFQDVPCVHAGGLRRIEYMLLRDRCLDLHFERAHLHATVKEMEHFFRKAASKPLLDEAVRSRIRELLSHYFVLEAIEKGSGLLKEALKEKLATLTDDKELVALATEKWALWRRELMAGLNARLELFRADIRSRAVTSWKATVVGFKRHLYGAHVNCDCFLCLDASSALLEEEGETCYLCAEAAQVNIETPMWLATKMCGTCLTRALLKGLCAFCFGNIEHVNSVAQCGGRGDFLREIARSPSLGESSVMMENLSFCLSH